MFYDRAMLKLPVTFSAHTRPWNSLVIKEKNIANRQSAELIEFANYYFQIKAAFPMYPSYTAQMMKDGWKKTSSLYWNWRMIFDVKW